MKTIKTLILSVIITFLSVVPGGAQSSSGGNSLSGSKTVKAIEVSGNNTISIATILSKIKTRVGQEYLQSVISDDLKRLYNTGYFSDVRVDREDHLGGFKVIIYVEEKAIVEEITFSKTRHIKSRSILKKIKTQVGKFLDKKSLKDDIRIIEELYTKKGLTEAEVDAESFVDDVTGKASLHFVIREGYKIQIKDINIYGNDSFKDGKIRRVIKSKKKRFYRSGYLKKDILEEDMERIISFYEQEGYIDVKAEYALDYVVKGRIEVNIQIQEGRRYSVGSVILKGNKILSEKEVRRVMVEIDVGKVFSRERLSVDISNIRTLYFERGYIFAGVQEAVSLDPDTGRVDVSIEVIEGSVAYIEQVKVQGNSRTRDIVIRRELRLFPGDRFDGAKLKRSRQKLNNLGYFESVDFDIEDTDVNDRKDLVVQVKEAKTGTFSFGGGFSTVDQVVGFIQLEQRNFDFTNWPTFTGGGQQLKLRAETGSIKNNLLLSFTEPWLFDYPLSFGFDMYKTVRNRNLNTGYAYDEERLGGGLRFGKRFTDYISGRVSYKYETVTIENFETGVSADLLAEAGENTVSVLGFSTSRDTRDNVFTPTKGLLLTGGIDVAGKTLGGNKEFYRVQSSASYYLPFKFNSVLEFKVRTGMVDSFGDTTKVPIFERFFAGGSRSIRGYNERGVGPIDSSTRNAIGGEALLVANIEYTIPIIEFLKLAAFFDAGNVWSKIEDVSTDNLKTGMGLGVRVKTPIGPINLDYGIPLAEEPGEDNKTGKFYFSVSRGF